jgi:hypothetical protein
MARPHGRNFVVRRSAAMAIVAWSLIFLGCGTSVFCVGPTAQGADELRNIESQRREFTISVDGTKRGTCTMQIRRRSDGTIRMRSQAELRINFIVYRYNYNSAGTEVWKNGRLIAMENVADYNGTQYRVKADAVGKNLRLTVDGTVSQMTPDAWVSSYWQSPEQLALGELADRTAADPNSPTLPEQRGTRYVSIIDSDQGRKLRGHLVRVGEESLTVAGEQRACTHYRITGDAQGEPHIELWYDATGRLVRQDSTESRHRVRFELSEIAAE